MCVTGNPKGHLLILSGQSGKPITQVETPGKGESIYVNPQILVMPDGQNIVVFGTGGLDSPGGVYVVPLRHLMAGNISEVIFICKYVRVIN